MTAEKRAAIAARLATAARSRAVDRVTVEVVQALRHAGVRPVLLKGPVFDRWLYARDDPRSYGDTDLLVAPPQREPAVEVLATLGFSLLALSRHGPPIHAENWARGGLAGDLVDLHTSIAGATVDRAVVWSVLSAGTETIDLAGSPVEGTGPEVNALIVALHAAAHGSGEFERTGEDLARALARCDLATWRAAHRLALEIGAEPSFAAGLRMLVAGEHVADALSLPRTASASLILRVNDAPVGAIFLERLRGVGWRTRARMVARAIVPEREYVREWSISTGRPGEPLIVAYLRRWLERLQAFVPAVRALAAARRSERETADAGRGTSRS
jgi:hypothetical protein